MNCSCRNLFGYRAAAYVYGGYTRNAAEISCAVNVAGYVNAILNVYRNVARNRSRICASAKMCCNVRRRSKDNVVTHGNNNTLVRRGNLCAEARAVNVAVKPCIARNIHADVTRSCYGVIARAAEYERINLGIARNIKRNIADEGTAASTAYRAAYNSVSAIRKLNRAAADSYCGITFKFGFVSIERIAARYGVKHSAARHCNGTVTSCMPRAATAVHTFNCAALDFNYGVAVERLIASAVDIIPITAFYGDMGIGSKRTAA